MPLNEKFYYLCISKNDAFDCKNHIKPLNWQESEQFSDAATVKVLFILILQAFVSFCGSNLTEFRMDNVNNGVFWGGFRGVLHQFPEFWGCVAQLRHRWRHPVCVQGQLMTLQPSSRCCPLRCTEPGLLTPERRIRNSLGWGDPWRRFLSHCRILMSVVAHGFGAAASPTKNRKLNGCGNLERKGTFRTKCAHLMYLVWHWLPHLYLSISSFFFLLRILSTGKLGSWCVFECLR